MQHEWLSTNLLLIDYDSVDFNTVDIQRKLYTWYVTLLYFRIIF